MHQAEHGGLFKLDNAAGTGATVTDYSSDIISVVLNPTQNVGTYHTIDSRAQKAQDGGYGVAITIESVIDPGAASFYSVCADWLLAGGARTFEYYKPDDQTGSEKWTGECRISGISNAGVARGGSGNAATATITLVSDGAVTKSVVA